MSDSNSLDALTARARLGLPRSSAAVEKAGRPTEDDEDACTSFGYLRGSRDRALTLEFRFTNSNSLALPYSWLGPVLYDPSLGLLLRFVGDLIHEVRIEGSNLNVTTGSGASLYDRGILRHRVTWVREMSRTQLQRTGEGDVCIERIRVHTHKPDEEPVGVDWLEPFVK